MGTCQDAIHEPVQQLQPQPKHEQELEQEQEEEEVVQDERKEEQDEILELSEAVSHVGLSDNIAAEKSCAGGPLREESVKAEAKPQISTPEQGEADKESCSSAGAVLDSNTKSSAAEPSSSILQRTISGSGSVGPNDSLCSPPLASQVQTQAQVQGQTQLNTPPPFSSYATHPSSSSYGLLPIPPLTTATTNTDTTAETVEASNTFGAAGVAGGFLQPPPSLPYSYNIGHDAEQQVPTILYQQHQQLQHQQQYYHQQQQQHHQHQLQQQDDQRHLQLRQILDEHDLELLSSLLLDGNSQEQQDSSNTEGDIQAPPETGNKEQEVDQEQPDSLKSPELAKTETAKDVLGTDKNITSRKTKQRNYHKQRTISSIGSTSVTSTSIVAGNISPIPLSVSATPPLQSIPQPAVACSGQGCSSSEAGTQPPVEHPPLHLSLQPQLGLPQEYPSTSVEEEHQETRLAPLEVPSALFLPQSQLHQHSQDTSADQPTPPVVFHPDVIFADPVDPLPDRDNSSSYRQNSTLQASQFSYTTDPLLLPTTTNLNSTNTNPSSTHPYHDPYYQHSYNYDPCGEASIGIGDSEYCYDTNATGTVTGGSVTPLGSCTIAALSAVERLDHVWTPPSVIDPQEGTSVAAGQGEEGGLGDISLAGSLAASVDKSYNRESSPLYNQLRTQEGESTRVPKPPHEESSVFPSSKSKQGSAEKDKLVTERNDSDSTIAKDNTNTTKSTVLVDPPGEHSQQQHQDRVLQPPREQHQKDTYPTVGSGVESAGDIITQDDPFPVHNYPPPALQPGDLDEEELLDSLAHQIASLGLLEGDTQSKQEGALQNAEGSLQSQPDGAPFSWSVVAPDVVAGDLAGVQYPPVSEFFNTSSAIVPQASTSSPALLWPWSGYDYCQECTQEDQQQHHQQQKSGLNQDKLETREGVVKLEGESVKPSSTYPPDNTQREHQALKEKTTQDNTNSELAVTAALGALALEEKHKKDNTDTSAIGNKDREVADLDILASRLSLEERPPGKPKQKSNTSATSVADKHNDTHPTGPQERQLEPQDEEMKRSLPSSSSTMSSSPFQDEHDESGGDAKRQQMRPQHLDRNQENEFGYDAMNRNYDGGCGNDSQDSDMTHNNSAQHERNEEELFSATAVVASEMSKSTLDAASTYAACFGVPLHTGMDAMGHDPKIKDKNKKKERSCLSHKETIFGASFSPQRYPGAPQPFVATASQDSTVKVWNAATQRCVATLQGHSKDYECLRVAWAPHGWGGVMINDDALRVRGQDDGFRSVVDDVLDDNSFVLATAGANGIVKVWHLEPDLPASSSAQQSSPMALDSRSVTKLKPRCILTLDHCRKEGDGERVEVDEDAVPQVYALQFVERFAEMGVTGDEDSNLLLTSSDDCIHFWELEEVHEKTDVEDQGGSIRLRLRRVMTIQFMHMDQGRFGVFARFVPRSKKQTPRTDTAESNQHEKEERPKSISFAPGTSSAASGSTPGTATAAAFGGDRNPKNIVYVFDASHCPKNGLLAVALSDGSTRLVNGRGICVSVLSLPGCNVHLTAVAWDRQGNRLATCVGTGHLVLWNIDIGDGKGKATPTCLAIMDGGHQAGRPLFGARYCGGHKESLVLSWGVDGRLCLWDADAKGEVHNPLATLVSKSDYPIYAVDVAERTTEMMPKAMKVTSSDDVPAAMATKSRADGVSESKSEGSAVKTKTTIVVGGGADGGFLGVPVFLYDVE